MRLTMYISLAVLGAVLLILTPKGYAMSISPKKTPANVVGFEETSQIILSCPTDLNDADALCSALESALQQRAPNHQIKRGSHAPTSKDLAITLQITRADAHTLEGYLQWQTSASPVQKGPPVTLGVDDTNISPHMFGSFASGLVKLSKLPIR